MRKAFHTLLAALLGLMGTVPSLADAAPRAMENNQSITLSVFDRHSKNKDRVIKELLDVQRSLIISIQSPIPEDNAQNGYLLIRMTPEYIDNLLQNRQGQIVAAYQQEMLVGYILLTDIAEFKELYEDEEIGFIETPIDFAVLDTLLSQLEIAYIEQIAVKPGYSRQGVGKQLIEKSKKLKPGGLVADVFLEPLTNEASLQFFSKVGFEKVGVLHQYPRNNFPHAHQTQILFWNPDPDNALIFSDQ